MNYKEKFTLKILLKKNVRSKKTSFGVENFVDDYHALNLGLKTKLARFNFNKITFIFLKTY